MNILLIEPSKPASTIGGEDVFLYEPLALEYLGASVSRDHTVRILDLRLDHRLQKTLEEFHPEIVGITAYTVHVNVVRRIFEQVKECDRKILTVVGGHHATVAPDDFATPSIDLIVVGEGVFAFREIASRHRSGRPFDGIPGVLRKNGEGLTGTTQPPDTGIDEYPFPDRQLTARYRKDYYSEWMKPLASMRTSKGCPYRCSFCAEWKIAGGRYYKRDPYSILEELKGIYEEYVFFADDESLVDPARMAALAGLIKSSGIRKRYFLYGRSDTIRANPPLLKAWRDIGLERVFVGLEFFRDDDLNFIRKRSTLEDNEAAVRILHDLGIDVYASFIVRPEFTKSDFATLRAYCRHLDLSFASYAVLTPLPGTDLRRDVASQMVTTDYDYFDFLHTLLPTRLSLKEFYSELSSLYRHGTSFARQLSFLRKYPVRRIPRTLLQSAKIQRRLRSAYRDYQIIS